MKICKYCKEEIAQDASKCPKCQSMQTWYGNPFFLMFVPMLVLFPLMMYLLSWSRPEKVDFETYRNQVTITQLGQDTVLIKEEQKINILVEIDNPTDKKWKNPMFEVSYLSASGELLNVEQMGGGYRVVIPPKLKTRTSIKTRLYKEYQNAKIEVKISHLGHDRYL